MFLLTKNTDLIIVQMETKPQKNFRTYKNRINGRFSLSLSTPLELETGKWMPGIGSLLIYKSVFK